MCDDDGSDETDTNSNETTTKYCFISFFFFYFLVCECECVDVFHWFLLAASRELSMYSPITRPDTLPALYAYARTHTRAYTLTQKPIHFSVDCKTTHSSYSLSSSSPLPPSSSSSSFAASSSSSFSFSFALIRYASVLHFIYLFGSFYCCCSPRCLCSVIGSAPIKQLLLSFIRFKTFHLIHIEND